MKGKIVNPDGLKKNVQSRLFEYLMLKGVKLTNSKNFHCFSEDHTDNKASAGLSENKLGFKCHGCGISGDIFTACNIIEGRKITGADFFNTLLYLADTLGVPYKIENKPEVNPKVNKQKTAEYPYYNLHGEIQYKTIRNEWYVNGKKRKEIIPYSFKSGKWKSGYKDIERILYKLPNVKDAIDSGTIVFFVEGEKCVDIICSLGLTATTIPGGSKAWVKPHTRNYITQLAGARVVILPDNDKAGNDFAKQVAMDIINVSESVKIIDLDKDKKMPPKGDIEQWLQLGGNKEQLLSLVEKTSEFKLKNEVDEENLPKWYEVNPSTKKVKVNSGILARHLINTVPAICIEDSFNIYEKGVYRELSNSLVSSIIKDCIEDRYSTMSVINDTQGLWSRDKDVIKKIEEINPNPYIINVKNGLLNIRTEELQPHTADYISTIQLNVNYNPDAKGEKFKEFILNALPNDRDRMIAQEMTGYLFTVFTQAKHFFVLMGQTNSGKSTFLNAIQKIITEKHLAHIPLQELSNRFNKAELFGKLANIVNELPDTAITDVGFLKSIVGQDPIQGERKGRDPFNFVSKAKHVFACNNLPSNYGDNTDALYKKLIIIPFNTQIPDNEIDPLLPEKLEQELEYIFAWGIEGLRRLIKNDFRFTKNRATEELVKQHKLLSNPVLSFVEEECIIGNVYYIGSKELYMSYQTFCYINGIKPLSSIKFNSELQKHYGETIIRDQIGKERLRVHKGITLKGKTRILPNPDAGEVLIRIG